MLDVKFLKSLLETLSDSLVDFNLDVVFQGSEFSKSISDVESLYGEKEIEEIEIKFEIPLVADFETELYCDHMVETYSDLPLTYSLWEHELTLTVNGPIDLDGLHWLCDEVKAFNEYPDTSDIDGYYEKYSELLEEALRDYGLDDFARSIEKFMLSLWPLADLDDLSDHVDIDCEWFTELFSLTLSEDYVENNSLVFVHDFKGHEDEIVNTLQKELGLELDDNCNTEDLIPFGSINTLYYPVMALKDFTLTQLANVVWLQENKEWSDSNLIFVSGHGFYIKYNRYSRQVIKTIQEDYVLSRKTLRKLANKMADTKHSWWSNWQRVVHGLAKIEGLEWFSRHYKHGDKYDTVAKEIFLKLVDLYPHFCSLSGNWWSLKINTKIIPDAYKSFDRHNRSLSEFSVELDFARAMDDQIYNFPDTFLDSLRSYCEHRIKKLSE